MDEFDAYWKALYLAFRNQDPGFIVSLLCLPEDDSEQSSRQWSIRMPKVCAWGSRSPRAFVLHTFGRVPKAVGFYASVILSAREMGDLVRVEVQKNKLSPTQGYAVDLDEHLQGQLIIEDD